MRELIHQPIRLGDFLVEPLRDLVQPGKAGLVELPYPFPVRFLHRNGIHEIEERSRDQGEAGQFLSRAVVQF